MSTSDAFMSFSRCSMSKLPRGSGRYGTPAMLHSNTSFSYSFRPDATFGVSLLRRFMVSSVQMCAWASIATGFGILVLPINVMAGLVPAIDVFLDCGGLISKAWMPGTIGERSDAVLRTAMAGLTAVDSEQ